MKQVENWLDLLCCPQCNGELTFADGTTYDDGHIATGMFTCVMNADHQYPVIDGIPRFASLEQAAHVENTVRGFGHQWNEANQDVLTSNMIQPELFLDFIHPVPEDYFAGKTVLDGGCGQARFTRAAQSFGVERIVGVDLSDAVVPAFENTRHLENVLIVQGDLLQLPFKANFDYAFSVGVLHHTADPRGAFDSVASVVKPEGGISAWVYGRENNGWIIYGLNPIRKHITSHLPYRLLWWIATLLGWILTAIIHGVYLPVDRSPMKERLKRFLFYYDYFCWLGNVGGRREITLVIFDHLVPEIAEYIAHDDFVAWFTDNGFADPTITAKANNSWRGFGEKQNAV